MTRRVLLNSTGLHVSRPGVDVLGAAKVNLLFSSDWSQVGLFERGSVTLSWGGGSSGSSAGSWSQAVNLSETFDGIPMVAFTLRRGGVTTTVGDISGFTYAQVQSTLDSNGVPVERGFTIRGIVSTNRITLRANYFRPSGEFGTPNGDGTVIGYSVMRYPF